MKSFSNTVHVAVMTLNSFGFIHDLAVTDHARASRRSLKHLWGEEKVQNLDKHLVFATLIVGHVSGFVPGPMKVFFRSHLKVTIVPRILSDNESTVVVRIDHEPTRFQRVPSLW